MTISVYTAISMKLGKNTQENIVGVFCYKKIKITFMKIPRYTVY